MSRFPGIVTTLLLIVAAPAQAADPAVKCENGKLKETGKYANCRLKAHATAVSKNLPPDFSKCIGKYAPKFEKLEDNAGAGVCPSEDDTASIQARVESDSDDLATLLGGGSLVTCGDDVAEEDEDCDGTDLSGASCVSLGFASGTLGCTAGCEFELAGCNGSCDTCGNAVIDGDEDCDWGILGPETCASLGYLYNGALSCNVGECTYDESDCESKRVFVTSATFDGDLGGIAGADAKCTAAASAASLGGSWKAWVATIFDSPWTSFLHSSVAYVKVNGQKVADDFNDLSDALLESALDVDENGTSGVNSFVWSGVDPFGNWGGSHDLCQDWTSNSPPLSGRVGISTSTTGTWSYITTSTCNSLRRLYCFEQ